MQIILDESYNVRLSSLTLGYVGETNARTITFSGLEVAGAELYKLRLSYPYQIEYEVDITGGEYIVDGSLLRVPCDVQAQILACKVVGDTYELVKKSNIFKLEVKPSLVDEPAPVPTYEQSVEALEKVLEAEIAAQECIDSAEAAKRSAESAKQSEQSAAASAQSAGEDAASTSADRQATAADRATVEVAKAAVDSTAAQVSADRTAAETAKDNALTSANNAQVSEDNAAVSAENASAAKAAAETARDGAQAAKQSTEISKAGAEQTAERAAQSAAAAKASEDNAGRSEQAVLAAKAEIDSAAKEVSDKAAEVAQNAEAVAADRAAAETAADTAVEKSAEIAGSAEQITQNTADIEKMRDVIFLNPMNHNGIFRGKNLTNAYTIEEMYERIHNGTFEDLYLGDYFTVSITTTLPENTVRTENVQLMFAHFNYYINKGNSPVTAPNAILIPRNAGFATMAEMNKTNSVAGGYSNSYMHKVILPCYAKSLKVGLNNHLLSYSSLLTDSVNENSLSMAGAGATGASTSWQWVDIELKLLNEVQVYGTTVWSSSAYDVGTENEKLAVFNFINPIEFDRADFWLCSIFSLNGFSRCDIGGLASRAAASVKSHVRPQILFG